ncbi:M16 family metallopeptidase [Pendulispora albinea]|uniref:Insulinase family protein n=1 Tax=Pendulispora albinea TaxID=2741071 RepID=A0ABZ2LNI3_9BACT
MSTSAFRTVVLDNGLRVVAVAQPQLHRAHVGLYVRVGSRYETVETNGLSHFLEHMLYRGTDRLKNAHDVNLAFERLGGYLYAATQADFGVFSVTLPPESLEQACALFSEVIHKPAFCDIEIEKGIVCEEILEDLDDEGRQVDADNLSRALIYGSHPLGFTITGDEKNVRSFTTEALRTHYVQHYNASSSVLVFSGAIDVDAAIELGAKSFGDLPRGERFQTVAPPFTQKKPRIRIVENMSSQTELRVCFRTIAENAAERPALDMFMRVLDDGMSTRLYHRICDSQGLCYDVGASYDGYEDDGVVDFVAGAQHARTTRVTEEILDLVRELGSEGPTEEELVKARQRHLWELSAMRDSPDDLGAFYAVGYLFDRFETPEEKHAKLASVTADEVRAIVRRVAQPERLNVVAVGLLENGEDKRLTDLVKGYSFK